MDLSYPDFLYQWIFSENESVIPIKQVQLMKRFGSAEKIFGASESQLQEFGITTETLKINFDPVSYEKRYAALIKQDISVLGFQDADYPQRLLEIASYPILLFFRGDISVLQSQHILSIVGSRDMTDYGKKVLESIMPVLCQHEIVIVSGMAFGVDVNAHEQCLRHKGKTIAVQAQGVERGYPRSHQSIYEKILKNGGCVISEFSHMERGRMERYFFPRRNRILSGVSDAVLVIEAKERSGSLITARYGMEQNRNVMAVPGGIFQKMSQGCLQLIRDGAKIVVKEQDVLEEFGLHGPTQQSQLKLSYMKTPHVSTDVFETPLERKIFEICVESAKSIDDIMLEVQDSLSYISATITKMELMGKLKALDGRRFVAIES